jgi:hypothetical protein
MSASRAYAALRRHLRAQERASRRDAARRARLALAHIRTGRFFLAIGELIEAEVAKAEAEARGESISFLRAASLDH